MKHTPISCECFPPNTPAGSEKLKTVVQDLAATSPEFFSVTYGAGGSTREKTLATVQAIAALGHEAAPHLSCVGSTADGIRETLALVVPASSDSTTSQLLNAASAQVLTPQLQIN